MMSWTFPTRGIREVRCTFTKASALAQRILFLVFNQFVESWHHHDKQPPSQVLRIVNIQPPYSVFERYYEYMFVVDN